jgi:hypothetical protein
MNKEVYSGNYLLQELTIVVIIHMDVSELLENDYYLQFLSKTGTL